MKTLFFNFMCIFIIMTASAIWTPAASTTSCFDQQLVHVDLKMSTGTYSWTAHSSANSYQTVLTPRGSGSPIVFNTTNTFISLTGLPGGVYNVTVYAIFSKGASSIIVEDIITI